MNGEHTIADRLERLISTDPMLAPYEKIIERRLQKIWDTAQRLTKGSCRLSDASSGHEFFGLHFRHNEWVFREWAPNATAVYLVGDVTGWGDDPSFRLTRVDPEGVFEIRLPAKTLHHKSLYRLRIHWPGGAGDRIPTYARRVIQDPDTLIFNAQVWKPQTPYRWKYPEFRCRPEPLYVYEAHVGMAQEEEGIGTYTEFTETVLPKIIRSGYNTLQLMAVQEHPYYASFGYHVSNFFAASSRFGTPDDLKRLIDTAHGSGLRVIMDLVHSHAVSNEVEGLGRFDGTDYQFFHTGSRGVHHAWNSRCFDYGKHSVVHFLLSNCRFWLDEYRIDGFRFDGITSMLYLNHGLEKAFTSYDDYFDETVDEDALTYLALANRVIHEVRPDAVTIAEDVSGMPGLAAPEICGGIGFDFRFAMGIPDFWIKLIKTTPDEYWPMDLLWYELTNRREEEKTISYAESHDQALVGDQTLIFRLMGSAMYGHMRIDDGDIIAARGMALIKMIRLITLATAGSGYLNFMGNEFGHPEWIDFPRQGNNWSFKHARRQWHLMDDSDLKYALLAEFDRDMIRWAKTHQILQDRSPRLLYVHNDDSVIAFSRGDLLYAFNFHPEKSYADYRFAAPPGKYRMVFTSDDTAYGGHGRLRPNQIHLTLKNDSEKEELSLYLPHRTAVVLQRH